MGKRPSKPPPIILYGVEEVNKLVELLESTVDKDFYNKACQQKPAESSLQGHGNI